MKRRAVLLAGLFVLAACGPAWAVQTHGQAEGPVVHQMAHLLLVVALLLMLYVLHTKPPDTTLSWRSLKLSLLFFLLWNLDLLVIHHVADLMPADVKADPGGLSGDYFVATTPLLHLAYYLGRLDHLLCVPALWFFTSALRQYCLVVARRQQSRSGQARP